MNTTQPTDHAERSLTPGDGDRRVASSTASFTSQAQLVTWPSRAPTPAPRADASPRDGSRRPASAIDFVAGLWKTLAPRSRPTRRPAVWGLLAVLAALAAGCWQRSLHPFYTPADLIPDPGLAGAWYEVSDGDGSRKKDGQTWSFTRVDDQRLDLVMVADEGRTRLEYEARAFRLGDARFLDLFSRSRAVDSIPAHHLFRLVEVGTQLRVTTLNPEWISKWLGKHPGSLAHVVIPASKRGDHEDNEQFVLAADTAALQRFVREHLGDDEFFTGETVFRREPSTTAPRPESR